MADAPQNYIDGKFVDARDGSRFDVFNPATGEMIGYKSSGVGRELGKEGLDDYLEKKAVYVNLAD